MRVLYAPNTAFVELTVPDEPASHLTAAQDATLRAMCARFDVPYDPDKYHPTFDLPATWVAGWVGPIYVGVDPEGHAHT